MPRLLRPLRLLAAVTLSALLAIGLAPAASATAVPDVPTIAQVAKVYPFLSKGTAYDYPMTKVEAPGKKCGKTVVIKGAKGHTASYAIPGSGLSTAKKPSVMVTALRFRSATSAKSFLAKSGKRAGRCPGPDMDVKVTKLKVNLGDQSWGVTIKATDGDTTYASQSLMVRSGKLIVTTIVGSADGKAPKAKKAIAILKVGLKAAR